MLSMAVTSVRVHCAGGSAAHADRTPPPPQRGAGALEGPQPGEEGMHSVGELPKPSP